MDQFERAYYLAKGLVGSIHIFCCLGLPPQFIEARRKLAKSGSRPIDIKDTEMDAAGWRRYGEAIKKSTKIEGLELDGTDHRIGRVLEEIGPEVALCLQSFFEEVKENKSIQSFKLDAKMSMAVTAADLRYFFENNQKLEEIELWRCHEMSPVQSAHISMALRDVCLKKLSMTSRVDNMAFEQILSACRNVKEFFLTVMHTNYHFTSLSEFLQDPATSLEELHLERVDISPNFDKSRAENELLTSLAENTNLRVLKVVGLLRDDRATETVGLFGNDRATECFKTLLCNTATIDSVCQSNHSLQTIELRFSSHVNEKVQEECGEYLELNKNPNKKKVIRNKIFQFHFKGDFDGSFLSNMNLAELAQILGMDVQEKQSAMFNILKNVPELCAVSSRGVV